MSTETNKIFAAILIAGIVASLSGFIAHKLVSSEELKENAVMIESAEAATGAGGAAAATGPEPILALIAAADVAKGEKISKACAACHSFDKGGATKVGPNLWGVVGGPKAHVASFAYSDGLKGKGGKWDYDSLNHFLWKPKAYIADTKMTFVGLKKPEDRAALIAWLRAQADSPAALPSDGDIAAEKAASAPPAETAAPAAAEAPAETPAH